MKKTTTAALLATAAAALVPTTLLGVSAASTTKTVHDADQPGSITIQSWLYAVPSENVLSGTVWDCFEISGAINDQGGGPTWTDDTSYHAPNTLSTGAVAAAAKECADKVPAGGFVLVPPPEAGQYQFATYTAAPGSPGGLSTVYAVHTIAGQKGDIYITFSGTYNMTNEPVKVGDVTVQPLTTGPQCTWVITGGTGAYAGLQGDGTCFANAEQTFPWINHTEEGSVWWTGSSKAVGNY
ncbi:MAG TPA: hypothetical protein VK425_11005 [Acidimicrobiales bacterium]|nr:hypothetical protein [Acidimicrobiales bacterium]